MIEQPDFTIPIKKYFLEGGKIPTEINDFKHGRWSCPACGKWRFSIGTAIRLIQGDTKQKDLPQNKKAVDGRRLEPAEPGSWCIRRCCRRCDYTWYTHTKIDVC